MTSHVEYLQDQDLDQLNHLIAAATKRRDELRDGPFVRVWVVADRATQGHFAYDDYAGAVALLKKLAKQHAESGKPSELSLARTTLRQYEADAWIQATKEEVT